MSPPSGAQRWQPERRRRCPQERPILRIDKGHRRVVGMRNMKVVCPPHGNHYLTAGKQRRHRERVKVINEYHRWPEGHQAVFGSPQFLGVFRVCRVAQRAQCQADRVALLTPPQRDFAGESRIPQIAPASDRGSDFVALHEMP